MLTTSGKMDSRRKLYIITFIASLIPSAYKQPLLPCSVVLAQFGLTLYQSNVGLMPVIMALMWLLKEKNP